MEHWILITTEVTQPPDPGQVLVCGLLANQATQQEVSGGWVSEAPSVLTAAPLCSHYRLSSASCQISSGIRSTNPTVNCACEGFSLRTPYENQMPDVLWWHLNHPETITPPPGPWKICLPQNSSLVPKKVGKHWITGSIIQGWEGCPHISVIIYQSLGEVITRVVSNNFL